MLQAVNYLLPLATLPYLVRVLGPGKFGLVAFIQAFINYFAILTDYGFSYSATRQISIYRDDKERVSKIFSSVMVSKLLLGVFSFFILALFLVFIPRFNNYWPVYLFAFGVVFGNILFPTWFFQGMERMKYITFLNITAKLIFTVSIFLVVKNSSQFEYVPLLNSLGFLVAGVLSLIVVFKNFDIKFIIPGFDAIIYQFKEGWHVFISVAAMCLYTSSNSFILGLFADNVIVGYYSAAEKLIYAAEALLTPLSQSIYPYVSNLFVIARQQALKFINKLIIIVGIGTFVISSVIFVLAKPIVFIILGSQYQQSVTVLRIMAFLPFIVGLSNVLGIQTMLASNMKKAFSAIIISGGILNIALALTLAYYFKQIGIAFSVLTTETFITFSMFVYLSRKGIKFFHLKL